MAAATLAAFSSATAPGALVVLDFEDAPAPPSGTQVGVSSYAEDGLVAKPVGPEDTTPPFRLRRNAGDLAGFPDNGGAYLQLAFGDSFVLAGSSPFLFTPISIDLAEYSTGTPDPLEITFTGFIDGGGSVSHTFTTDGIIDGPGGAADFESFFFPSTFANINRLESATHSFSLDRLVLEAIPEPSCMLLLLTAIGLIGRRRCSRPRHDLAGLALLGFVFLPTLAQAQGPARPPGAFWQQLNGLLPWELDIDHDADGFTARQEYAAGTDPFDHNAFLSLDVTLNLPDVTLAWDSVAGAVYQVLYSPDMTTFAPVLGPVEGTGTRLSFDLTPQTPGGFFCLEALEPVDFDNDGLSAIEEALAGTDARVSDTDRDSILDGAETLEFGSDPTGLTPLGATLRGTVFNDADNDGNLDGESPLAGVTVYLDANFNGTRDDGERVAVTDREGNYVFRLVPPGLHHLRQDLPEPNVQTFPGDGVAPTANLLPDEILDYTHAAPGIGNLDVPYGQLASEWPGEWGMVDNSAAVEVSPQLLLKPIGARARRVSNRQTRGSEYLSLPTGAAVTLRFDEVIVDGAGPDFFIQPQESGVMTEPADIYVGALSGPLTLLGEVVEDGNPIFIDLADYDYSGVVQRIRIVGKDTGGNPRGFDLVGVEAIHIAPPSPAAHIVTIAGNEIVADLDFGRYFRDLPPTVVLALADALPATSGLRAGESAVIRARAYDDFGIAAFTVMLNGQPLALDANGEALVPTATAGKLYLEAIAEDTAGQTTTRSAEAYVARTDGSLPYDPGAVGRNESSPSAPRTRILTPGPGFVSAQDTAIVAEIIGNPAATEWTVEYAPVDAIDPYNLSAPDPDYIPLATGSGNVYASPVATMPLASLPDGIYFVRLCARNAPTRIACQGQVIAKNVPEADLRPRVNLSSPAPGSTIMVTADIAGTIVSARPVREWFVEYAPANQVDPNNLNALDPDWKRIAEGTGTVDPAAILARFDATTVKNNSYIVRVVARNDIGLGWAEPLALEVAGEAKFGRNRLEFTDLDIDLAGFPLRFTRVYDSLQADEEGELGFGWSLDLQDPDIRETVPDTGSFGLFGSTPFRDGTRVYITAPTGERLGFTFMPEVGAASAFGAVSKATFVPDPGVYHQLSVPEGARPFLDLKADGNVFLFFLNFPYNPEKYVLTEPGGNRYTYHEDRGFLRAEDPNGNSITLNPGGIRHSAGLGIDFTRDDEGRISAVAAPGGETWNFAYDAAGDLVATTDPEGRTTTYSYLAAPAHYLASITDPLGRLPARYEYDPISGRLVAVIDENGNRREQSWNPGGFTGTVTTPRGFATTLEYDARGNVTRETDPLGNVTAYTYDDPVNPDLESTLTDPAGHVWRYQYDAAGNLTQLRPPMTGAGAANGSTLASYDTFGNVTSVRGPDNRTSTFTYDTKGNLLTQRSANGPHFDVERAPNGRPRRIIEDESYATDVRFDAKGQFAGLSDNTGYQASVSTDRNGFIRSITGANGETSQFAYDSQAFPKSQIDANGNALVTIENPDGSKAVTDRDGIVLTVATDAEGRPTTVALPGGGVAATNRDAAGNLTAFTDPLGNTTAFGYDAKDRLNTITSATGGTETREYDSRGLQTAATLPSGKRRTFEYDANRHLVAERWHDAGGAILRTIAFDYALSGALTDITDTAGAVTHTFEFSGGAEQPNTVATTYHGQTRFVVAYQWGRVQATTTAPVHPESVILRRGSIQLNSIRATRLGGRTYELEWFGSGNSIRLLRNPDGSLAALDRRTRVGNNNEHSLSTFAYHPDGALARIRHLDVNGALIHPSADLAITRGAGGGVSTLATATDIATATYDDAMRLIALDHSNAALPDETYSYDLAGNRLSSHLLTGPATIGSGNQLLAAGNLVFTYDADGNLARRTDAATGRVTDFSYDHRNRLVLALVRPSAGAPPETTVELDYDYANRLIRRTIDGVNTWIMNDRQMHIGEFADGATEMSRVFLYSLDRLDDYHAALLTGVGERWFLNDSQGSVRGVLDDNGALVSWSDYDAFGNLLGTPPPDAGLPRHVGRFFLPELGLYENRRRFFDPLTGRFTQPDPLRFAAGDVNLYSYVGNDPLNRSDPSGLSPAIDYGMLVEVVAFYADNLCKLGSCVGGLWKGVTEGVINVQPPDISEPIKDCTIAFLGITEDCGIPDIDLLTTLQLAASPPGLPPLLGGTIGVIGTVDSCHKMVFDKQIFPECIPIGQ